MSVTYGFYNAINHDRTYDAVQMSSIFDGIIKDGIFMSIGDHMAVSATTGMGISVGTGRAWFNHTWTLNDAILPLTVEQAEVVLDRIDAVVLEVNADDQARENSIKIIKGTPSSTPVRPTMQDTETLHQYALAYIAVGSGVTEITQADITNNIGLEDTPFITGILDTINIDTLIAQWQSQWDNWISDTEAEETEWFTTMRNTFETWAQEQRLDFNDWSTEQKEEFETWFETIRDILDEDVAGHLQNEIDALAEVVEENRHLVHIILDVDSESMIGAHITATNGDETYTEIVNEGDTEIVFNGKTLGTWSISEDKYGSAFDVETTFYGNYFGEIGGGVIITLTYSEDYYGKVLKLQNGDKIIERVAPSSPYGMVFAVREHGTWTVTGILDGAEYTTSIDVTTDGEYEMYLDSYTYKGWLTVAGISDTFGSLEAVLASEPTIRILMDKHASVNYLVSWIEKDQVIGAQILKNDLCAKWINLCDYCFDKIEASTVGKALMDSSGVVDYGETGLVPKMTSNNAPYGVAYAYGSYISDAYHAFNGNEANRWLTQDAVDPTNAFIGYQFVNPTKVNKVLIKPYYYSAENVITLKQFKVQASNNYSTWTDLTSIITAENRSGDIEVTINEPNYYTYYRIVIMSKSYYSAYAVSIVTLQFYGSIDYGSKYGYGEWTLLPQVPKMTSNTAPYGTVISSAPFSTYYAWKAFDKNNGTGDAWLHNGNGANSAYIGYQFVNPIICKRVKITNWSDNVPRIIKSFKIQGSNDGTNWIDLTQETQNTGGNVKSAESIYEINNDNAYLYYRLFVISVYDTTYCGVGELQFYSWQPKGNVPIMTSNSAPYGTAIGTSLDSSRPLYYAFDGDDSLACEKLVQSGSLSAGFNVGYTFVNPVCAKRVHVMSLANSPKKYIIQGSNDGSTWTDLSTDIVETTANIDRYVELDNDDYYMSYRVYVKEYYNAVNVRIYTIQFYGRELSVSVPKMTSNTAPWGEVITNNAGVTTAFQAFDKNTTTMSYSTNANYIIGYDFGKPVKVCFAEVFTRNGYSGNYKISASNDKSTWEDFDTTGTPSATTRHFTFNGKPYRYWAVCFTSGGPSTDHSNQIYEINFYALDYSERTSRHYIYDHGVEVEELDGSNYKYRSNTSDTYWTQIPPIVNSNNIELNAGGSHSTSIVGLNNKIDLSDYTLVRAKAVDGVAGAGGNFGYIGIETAKVITGGVQEVGYNNILASDKPNNVYCDISNLNSEYYLIISSSATIKNTITEWWLE